MPRIVRNFWVDLRVDGRKSDIGTGPRSSNGGLRLRIYQRSAGEVLEVAQISCEPRTNSLVMNISSKAVDGFPTVFETITCRDAPGFKCKRDEDYGRKRLMMAWNQFVLEAKHQKLPMDKLQELVDKLMAEQL